MPFVVGIGYGGRMLRAVAMSFVVLVSCGAPASGDDGFGPAPCTPGEQRACACAGGEPPGVQVCAADGAMFGACMGCGDGATTATGGEATTGDASSDDGALEGTSGAASDPSETTAVDTGIPGDGIPDGPPQAVPPAPPPDGSAIVEQVAALHPDWLLNSCVETGGDNAFLFEVVRRLRAQDDRWGLNWKRGVIDDLSQDVVDYHWGEGPSEESTDVYIIDMIGGHCPKDATPPQPSWIDVTQATLDAGTVGMWTLAGQDL